MSDDTKSKEELLVEVQALRRKAAELEVRVAAHERAERAIQTEARAAKAALRQSEATAQALLESASDGIVLADARGRITRVNAAGGRMFGYADGELVGAELEVLLPARARRTHVEHRTRYFREPRVRPMGIGLDLQGRRRDGSEFPVEVSLSYVGSGEDAVAMAFITDITERKRIEGQLRQQREVLFQSEKLAALGRLAAGVAHEINNPLAIISSRIEVMLLDAVDLRLPDSLLEDLRVLHRTTERAGRIASSLRSFARQSSGERVPVSLNAVVDETLLLMERPLATGGIEIATALDRTLPSILGDTNELHQVLVNLLTNAREAMTGPGTIRIETGWSEHSGHLRLTVTDTGSGISPRDLPNIFDPFFTTKPDGTGLGLSLSYGIIQDHQGTVDVRSEPGRGASFILTFPTVGSD